MSTTMKPTEAGTAFLTTPVSESADKIFTLEQRDEEQRWIEESAATFGAREVFPHIEAIDQQKPGLMPSLVKKAGEQGLLSIDVPEAYGGAELGLLTSCLVASQLPEASFSVAFGAHTTIGTLPIVYYGTEEQKQRYLPKLAAGEWISAYALTEPGVGSDAMNLSTRAELSEDGKYYILNGTKQWISNAGFADVMVAFARIGDERPSAFIVETSWPGVSTGAEEHKMGIKGSSTRRSTSRMPKYLWKTCWESCIRAIKLPSISSILDASNWEQAPSVVRARPWDWLRRIPQSAKPLVNSCTNLA
jgi:alkylation response protein AidB-like acyl-CoA dehydrogenase